MEELTNSIWAGGDLFYKVVVPILSGFLGWVYSTYRNRQKKEHDILDNIERVLALQDAHVQKTEKALERSDKLNQRLEAKLDRKSKSVRAANRCMYTNEGDGCPVLNQEELNEHVYQQDCSTCEYSKTVSND